METQILLSLCIGLISFVIYSCIWLSEKLCYKEHEGGQIYLFIAAASLITFLLLLSFI